MLAVAEISYLHYDCFYPWSGNYECKLDISGFICFVSSLDRLGSISDLFRVPYASIWTNITMTISAQDQLKKDQSFRLYSVYVIIYFSCHQLASTHSALFFNDLFQFIVAYITSITRMWITLFGVNFVFEDPLCILFFFPYMY